MTNGDNNSGDVSRDLDIDESIKDPVEDRRTLAERSERLHDQLKVIEIYIIYNRNNLTVTKKNCSHFFAGTKTRFGTISR